MSDFETVVQRIANAKSVRHPMLTVRLILSALEEGDRICDDLTVVKLEPMATRRRRQKKLRARRVFAKEGA